MLNPNHPARVVISTFFHELSHYLDHRDGLFKRFYSLATPKYVLRRIALRAERHADERGRKECQKMFPRVKYVVVYRSSVDVHYLKLYYKDWRKKR